MITKGKGSSGHGGAARQFLLALVFIFLLSFFFAVYSHVDFSTPRPRSPEYFNPFRHQRHYNNNQVKEGFLVFSEQCQIPDVDPYHPTVRDLIKVEPLLNCSLDYPAVTWTEGNILRIRPELLRLKPFHLKNELAAVRCCFRVVSRKSNAKSDNDEEIGKDCIAIGDGSHIHDEFIKVECKVKGNKTVAYTNYHSFVHEKPAVEKRCNETSNDTENGDHPFSFLIVGADAMSRLNMHRQFKTTVKYLKEAMGAVEMYGFNKVGDNTLPNLVPFLTGIKLEELPFVCREKKQPFDKCPFIWKKYSEAGYRTLYAEDNPPISSFNYLSPGFTKPPTDYYYRPFIRVLEKELGRDKRLNCDLCVGSVSEVEAVLGWLEKFGVLFQKRPYFAFAWINSLTHDFLNLGSAGDVYYERFFRYLHSKGHLNRTIVMFMGDHGLRWGAIRSTYIGRMEERLPMLLVSFPQEFRRRYPSAVATFSANSHRLVTQFDLFATLQNLLHFNGSFRKVDASGIPRTLVQNFTHRAISLFEPVPPDRGCLAAGIDEHWCTCQKSEPVSVEEHEVQHVAEFVVHEINVLLEPQQDLCVPLMLRNVTAALLRSPHEHLRAKKNFDIFDYSVILTTDPNGAIYESTVRFVPHEHTHDLLGEVSRLNLYGNQSHCISDRKLKKYCLCRDMETF